MLTVEHIVIIIALIFGLFAFFDWVLPHQADEDDDPWED